MRSVACGATFIVALGKDVPEGSQKIKKKKRNEDSKSKERQILQNQRSRS